MDPSFFDFTDMNFQSNVTWLPHILLHKRKWVHTNLGDNIQQPNLRHLSIVTLPCFLLVLIAPFRNVAWLCVKASGHLCPVSILWKSLCYSDMDSENVPRPLWVCSSLLRMNWLVSMKRSTQFTKQTSVLVSSFGPGFSMHFSWKGETEEMDQSFQDTCDLDISYIQAILHASLVF